MSQDNPKNVYANRTTNPMRSSYGNNSSKNNNNNGTFSRIQMNLGDQRSVPFDSSKGSFIQSQKSSYRIPDSSQTIVRIRGKHNNLVETAGNIHKTMEQERQLENKRKEMRRSNERLRQLEVLE